MDAMDIKSLAKLAKLDLPDQIISEYERQAQEFLSYVEQLFKVDTSKVEPLVQPFEVLQLEEDNDRPIISNPIKMGPYQAPRIL